MKKGAASLLEILRRSSMAIIVDAIIVTNAYLLAMLVFVYNGMSGKHLREFLVFIPIAIVIHCSLNYKFGLYRFVGRYVGLRQALSVVKTSVIAVLILLLVSSVLASIFNYSNGYHALVLIPIGGMMVLILSGGVRFYPRIFYERSLREVTSQTNILVVGAGNAGEQVIRNIQKDPYSTMNVVVLVDDDPALKGMEIHGVTIGGSINDITAIINKKNVDEILIAIPSADIKQFQRIWKVCSLTGLPVKTLGSLQNTHFGKVDVGKIRDFEIEDVLGRQPVQTDYSQISQFIMGKVVMVTGAGGSIGSELVAQISQHGPSKIVLIDQDETALYQIHEKLKQRHFYNYDLVVADVRSDQKIKTIFAWTRPDVVFHAAAYKHVPLMEMHPDECVLNNVWGTLNMASVSGEYGVQSFINISTDKAVLPLNILGATKRLGERLVTELDEYYPDTRYCSVRFGNVLGSRGSVIPIFRQQILKGGPLTITDPQMTRYFMMISEAVDLVLQSAAFQDRNAIFVLDMGEPVKIVDLARQMIDFVKPVKPVEIMFTGLRPGEKLHEQLFDVCETPEVSNHEKIYRVSPFHFGETIILDKLPLLFDKAKAGDSNAIQKFMEDHIPSYKPFEFENIGRLAETGMSFNTGSVGNTVTNDLDYKWSQMSGADVANQIFDNKRRLNVRASRSTDDGVFYVKRLRDF